MFERIKIKKLISRLVAEEKENEKSRLISQLIAFGKISFQGTADSFQNREISAADARTILLKTYDNTFFDTLLNLAGNNNDMVRTTAKEVIINKITNDDIPKLIDNLQNLNAYIRKSCADILIAIKNHSAVLKLISLYNNAEADLKKTIIDILSSIGGNTAAQSISLTRWKTNPQYPL
jgi:HEAT repeat protein